MEGIKAFFVGIGETWRDLPDWKWPLALTVSVVVNILQIIL